MTWLRKSGRRAADPVPPGAAAVERRASGRDRRESPTLRRAMRACTAEGIAGQSMLVIVDYFMIPLALYLGGSAQQIGLLVAIPNLLASVAQLSAVLAVRLAGSRLRLILIGVAIQAATLVPICWLAVGDASRPAALLVLFIAMFRVFGALIGPAWGSLVSEYVAENERGRFFGARARYMGLASILNIIVWGFVLYGLKRVSPGFAFAALFGGALLYRVISFYFMNRMIDLPFHPTPEADFSFWRFVRRFRESNFVKFSAYVAAVTLGTNLAAPFFSVLMLDHLGFNYLQYTVVHLGTLAAGLVSFPIWGRHADVVGNARIIRTTGFVIPFIPLFWLTAQSFPYIVAVEVVSGFVWGGFNLCTVNFIYDAVAPEKRLRVISYFNLINGAAIFVGASAGGWLAGRLPSLGGTPLYSLFILSAALRLLPNVFLSRHFREVRGAAQPIQSMDLFYSVLGIRPFVGRPALNDIPPSERE